MWIDILFSILFVVGVYYFIRYRLNIKKAAEISNQALFPKTPSEFASLLIPTEWKEMEPLTKDTKSYKYVHWGTIGALVLLTALLVMVLVTDWFNSSFFSLVYFFALILNLVPHKGNLFLLSEGLILYGRYYSLREVRGYETEEIVRWHELYGLSDNVNYGYKLTIYLKRSFYNTRYLVVRDKEHLKQITDFFEEHGIQNKNVA